MTQLSQPLSRRRFLQSAALAGGVLALGGVSGAVRARPQRAPAHLPSFATTIEVWFDKWGPDELWTQLWTEIQEQTGITINPVVIPYSDLEAKTLTSLAGGVGPDIIYNHPIFVATWATKGVGVPLDEYLGRSNNKITREMLDDFFPGAMEYQKWAGRIWSLPIDFETALYYYNKTLIQKAGLDDPGKVWKQDSKAWNLDLYTQYATRLTSGSGDSKVYGASEIPKSLRTQSPFIWGFGGEVFSPDYHETLINSAEALAAWAYLADHVRKGWSPAVAGRDQPYQGTMTPLFNDNRLAMIYNIRGYLANLKPELDLGMVPMPTMPNGMQVTRCAPDSFAICTRAEDKDAAWEVLQIMILRGSELLVQHKAASPNRLSLLQSDVWSGALAPWEDNEMYIFANKTARALVLPPRFSEIDKAAQAAYDQIVLNQASEAEAMAAAKEQIDAVLAEVMA